MSNEQNESAALFQQIRRFAQRPHVLRAALVAGTLTSAAAIAFVAYGGLNQTESRTDADDLENMVSLHGEDCGEVRIVWHSATSGSVDLPMRCSGEIVDLGSFRGSAHIDIEGDGCKGSRLIHEDSGTRARIMVTSNCSVALL